MPLLVALVVLLAVGTLMPGSLKSLIQAQLGNAVPWDKLGHFVMFAAIAAVPVYGGGLPGTGRALLLAAALAGATELLQILVPGRYALWSDVGIDLAGAAMGRALWCLRALVRNALQMRAVV